MKPAVLVATGLLAGVTAASGTGCSSIRQLPLGSSSFTTGRVAVEEALDADDVDGALERARLFRRRFPGEVASGLLGEALWRSGRLGEAEGYLRRAAEAGDRRGNLGMARVAISRGRWSEAAEWARAADADAETDVLLLTIALATGDSEAAREHAAGLTERASRLEARVAGLAGMIADSGAPDDWQGEPGVVELEHSTTAGWLVHARFEGRPVRLRLALDAPRSWVRWDLPDSVRAESRSAEAAGPAGGSSVGSVVAGTLVLGPLRRRGVLLEARSTTAAPVPAPETPGDDGAMEAAELDGELGADLLADLRWSFEPGARRMVVARHEGRGWDAPEGISPDAREVLELPSVDGVQWLSARVLRRGLDAQWMLMPRLEARVMSAVVDWRRRSLLDDDVLPDLERSAEGPRTTLEARLGDWWPWVRWEIVDLSGHAEGGWVAPRMSLGAELFEGWRLLWDPGARQLGLVPEEERATSPPLPGGLQ